MKSTFFTFYSFQPYASLGPPVAAIWNVGNSAQLEQEKLRCSEKKRKRMEGKKEQGEGKIVSKSE